jgi:hypothetical protein
VPYDFFAYKSAKNNLQLKEEQSDKHWFASQSLALNILRLYETKS